MELYLLRHGDAETGGSVPDSERALTAEGRLQVTNSARALAVLASAPPGVLTSPLRRARQSAELAAAQFQLVPRIRVTEALAPPGDLNKLIDEIKTMDGDRVLLVGHEPFLGRLIWASIAGATTGAIPLRKAAAARVDLPLPVLGDGKLVWLMPAEVLRSLGTRRPAAEG